MSKVDEAKQYLEEQRNQQLSYLERLLDILKDEQPSADAWIAEGEPETVSRRLAYRSCLMNDLLAAVLWLQVDPSLPFSSNNSNWLLTITNLYLLFMSQYVTAMDHWNRCGCSRVSVHSKSINFSQTSLEELASDPLLQDPETRLAGCSPADAQQARNNIRESRDKALAFIEIVECLGSRAVLLDDDPTFAKA